MRTKRMRTKRRRGRALGWSSDQCPSVLLNTQSFAQHARLRTSKACASRGFSARAKRTQPAATPAAPAVGARIPSTQFSAQPQWPLLASSTSPMAAGLISISSDSGVPPANPPVGLIGIEQPLE